MGLFSKAISTITKPIGTVIGGVSEGIFGSPQGASFQVDTKKAEEAIGKIRDVRDNDITDVRQSAQIVLDRLADDRTRAIGDVGARQSSLFRQGVDQLGASGGIDSGARERLASQLAKQAVKEQQQTLTGFGGLETEARAGDIAAQEAQKEKALFSLPQLELMPEQLRLTGQISSAQSQAQADALATKQKGMVLSGLIEGGKMMAGGGKGKATGVS